MLNENIRNLRKAKGLSQEELAIKLNGKKVYLLSLIHIYKRLSSLIPKFLFEPS